MNTDPCPCWTDKRYANAGTYCKRCKQEQSLASVLVDTYPAIFDPFHLPYDNAEELQCDQRAERPFPEPQDWPEDDR